ncbi:MAG: C40 family peptidase [Acidaminococcales bacterium]|nr:C40 family peptidase [Acidaminococcales bacterium]
MTFAFLLAAGNDFVFAAKKKEPVVAEGPALAQDVRPDGPNITDKAKGRVALRHSGAALKFGMRGEPVEALQKRLQEAGYYRGAIDGIFGSATLNAVFMFQTVNGLTADGIVGADTIRTLNLPDAQIKSPPPEDVARGSSRGYSKIVVHASSFLGAPYVWGGVTPAGFDCSGFIYYLFGQYGVAMPRMADGQFHVGVPVERANVQAGDLVFFSTYEPGPSHVGIYMGDGNFIHASSAAGQITITSMQKAYYVERYLGARRLPPRLLE